MIINLSLNVLAKKIYVSFMTSSKMSERKHSTSLHVITSHIMLSDESENKSFWSQVAFQNTEEKNLWCIYAFWASTRITEVTCFLTWLMKYNLKKNELRHKLWSTMNVNHWAWSTQNMCKDNICKHENLNMIWSYEILMRRLHESHILS